LARRAIAATAAVVLATSLAIGPARPLAAGADILNYQGSSTVSGWNGNQADLLPTEVQDSAFGQRYDRQVSGQVFAQPVISDDGSGRRVMIVATENNDIYGVSPDSASLTPYWHDTATTALDATPHTLGAPWVIAKNSGTVNCTDITPNIGVTSTPVIDSATHTVYVTAKATNTADSSGATAIYRLHALSLVDGTERAGFPVTISGAADNDATITFDPNRELQRPGLLLMNGVVYMGFGGHCDAPKYYGWVVGVGAFGAASNAGAITARWADQHAADGFGAGIWMAGSALASDGAGNILLVTGNGTVPEANPAATVIAGTSPPNNLGQATVRLTVQSNGRLAATDFFSPKDNKTLNQTDLDLGSSGITVLPDSFGTTQHPHVAVFGGKVPILRSVDLAALGGFDANANHVMGEVNYGVNGGTSGTWGRAASWPGDGGWVYIVAMGDPVSAGSPRASGLVALQRSVDGSGNVQFVVKGTDPTADADWIQTSGSPSITSNGSSPLTAVVWAMQAFGHNSGQSRMMAFGPVPDSTGQLPLLWTGPTLTRGGKFTSPAVDSNHLYIGTRDDSINTAGTSHVYGYWLSKLPDLSETPYWFGTQAVNAPATITQTLTVRSASAVSITAASSADSHFVVGTPNPALNTSMSPSSTVQVPVTFTPTATGDVRSTISLTMSDGSTVKIGVGGTGVSTPPHLDASPTTVAFGNHAVGTTTTSSFQLTNSGSAALHITGSSISGNSAFTFSGAPAANTVVNPGDKLAVTVSYAPTQATPASPSPDTATVTVTSDANNATVSLNGTATPPGVLSVSPLNLDAGTVVIGQSATMHFTVANTGGTAITLSRSKPPGGDFIPLTAVPEGSTINPGVSKGVDVKFQPTVAGPQTGTWSFNSDGQGGLQTVTFTGNGVAPAQLSANPTSLAFGSQQTGTTTSQNVVISNSGGVALTISAGGGISGNAAFTVAGIPASGTTMNPGDSRTVTVTYKPTQVAASGQTDTATVAVNSSANNLSVPVMGTATAAPPPAQLAANPTALSFGSHQAGTSSSQTFQIRNSGGVALTIASGSGVTGNPAYTVSGIPASGTTMNPGDTRTVTVTYSPTQATASGQTDTAAVAVNSSANSVSVPVTGTATPAPPPAQLAARPTTLPFGNQQTGSSASQTFQISNSGGVALTISGGGIAGSSAFTVSGIPAGGTTMNPGDMRTVTVTYKPTQATSDSATVSVNSSANNVSIAASGTGVAPPSSHVGYWLVAADGGIFPFGSAVGYGSTGGQHLNQPIVGMATTPDGSGYWLVAADGGVFPFGSAVGYGSTGGQRLNQPVVGMAATPDGHGYWLVAADGGIFPFGSAGGYGSTGGQHLNQPIVGMAATGNGGGYWLVAADGGIFPFGNAGGYGSTGGQHLNQPVVGMAATPDGGGYWLVAADGGIFPFGNAGGYGSTGGQRLNQPIVGMAATGNGGGYWLVAADGGIFPFGNAPGLGSTGNVRLNQPMVGMSARS
jgi:hypothetical protein